MTGDRSYEVGIRRYVNSLFLPPKSGACCPLGFKCIEWDHHAVGRLPHYSIVFHQLCPLWVNRLAVLSAGAFIGRCYQCYLGERDTEEWVSCQAL